MNTLRTGDKGPDVKKWQYFLIGQGLLSGEADGKFGPATKNASMEFQRLSEQEPDGVVGNKTLGAAMLRGFGLVPDGSAGRQSPEWPPKPSFRPLAGNSERSLAFGRFRYKSAPRPGNREHIELLDNWASTHITTVKIPQLTRVKGSANVQFHRAAVKQLQLLWQDWDAAGLTHFVSTWGGSYMPRFVRGSTKNLSNHAFGSAFDINMSWNALGAVPALSGREGSVRELVELANAHGFYWGGHFTRLDGMHFEIAELR